MSEHGTACTAICKLMAVPSPLDRERPPDTSCPHCGAEPGVSCRVMGPRRQPLRAYGRSHPSRTEAAA